MPVDGTSSKTEMLQRGRSAGREPRKRLGPGNIEESRQPEFPACTLSCRRTSAKSHILSLLPFIVHNTTGVPSTAPAPWQLPSLHICLGFLFPWVASHRPSWPVLRLWWWEELDSNSGAHMYWLCDHAQVTWGLHASVFSSVKWVRSWYLSGWPGELVRHGKNWAGCLEWRMRPLPWVLGVSIVPLLLSYSFLVFVVLSCLWPSQSTLHNWATFSPQNTVSSWR